MKAFHLYFNPLYALVQLEIHLLFGLIGIKAFFELQPTGGMVNGGAQLQLNLKHSDASPCRSAGLRCNKERKTQQADKQIAS